ncbi:MAG: polyprenyl diphosphate synthase [Candidatus Nanoarchaeia archaeon]|nr:polyprenyl diphosphate synthase [Candidatus Nanoarchaeia archaeon]MDD5239296.1 polyprenyl diphosphate synthase [Candidatus Nanoarchaeia archaeon]
MGYKEPLHIGMILDGNRRYAQKHGLKPWEGHEEGKKALSKLIRYFANSESQTKYLTLYALSLDNFQKRSQIERNFLYNVLKEGFTEILDEPIIFEKKINIDVIGRWELLPDKELKEAIQNAVDATKSHKNKFIRFAICYDGLDEIVNAAQKIVDSNAKKVTKELIKENLFTKDLPPVDLLIRTGGEQRLSGFLLWDASYAELYFTETLFPDSIPGVYNSAIKDYANRQRRFGK